MASEKGNLYGLQYTTDGLDGLKSVEPKKHRRQVKRKIDKLTKDPRPRGAVKLKGVDHDGEPVYRIRSGDYRVLYLVRDNPEIVVVVLDVGHRKEIYRGI